MRGAVVLERKGIAKVSTFAGFCAQHDSELFRPIDTMALAPTDEQVALYGYRSLCREVFAKENAFALIDEQLELGGRGSRHKRVARRLSHRHVCRSQQSPAPPKQRMMNYSVASLVSDVEYTLFIFRQPPLLAFSAAFYPEFDFVGRQVQDLADHTTNLDLVGDVFGRYGRWLGLVVLLA